MKLISSNCEMLNESGKPRFRWRVRAEDDGKGSIGENMMFNMSGLFQFDVSERTKGLSTREREKDLTIET